MSDVSLRERFDDLVAAPSPTTSALDELWADLATIRPEEMLGAWRGGDFATGHPAPTYAVTSGSLPAGISLDPATGALTGVPTEDEAAYAFEITATNVAGSVTFTEPGGATQTVALQSASPARSGGNCAGNASSPTIPAVTLDQIDHTRTSPGAIGCSVGAFDMTSIFYNGFE